jgi:hypothetical protein
MSLRLIDLGVRERAPFGDSTRTGRKEHLFPFHLCSLRYLLLVH